MPGGETFVGYLADEDGVTSLPQNRQMIAAALMVSAHHGQARSPPGAVTSGGAIEVGAWVPH